MAERKIMAHEFESNAPRNWIEKAIGKRYIWQPICIGMKGHRKVYAVDWEDGTNGMYHIDFEEKTIEEVTK